MMWTRVTREDQFLFSKDLFFISKISKLSLNEAQYRRHSKLEVYPVVTHLQRTVCKVE